MIDWRPITIHARDLDDAWFLLLDYLFRFGREYEISAGSYAGQNRLTFDFVSGFINHPHNRPMAPRVPESCTLPPPTTDEEIDQYFANYIMNSDLEPNEDYRYATWVVGGWYEIPHFICEHRPPLESSQYITTDVRGSSLKVYVPNQIEWIIDHFQRKGLGNAHCYLTVGYPESNFAYDIPYNNETERRTSPCLRGLDFRVVENHLLTHVIYRSWDLVGGFPTNMGGFALLNQYVAEHIGVNPGPLSFSCKDLHAYSMHYDYLRSRLNK